MANPILEAMQNVSSNCNCNCKTSPVTIQVHNLTAVTFTNINIVVEKID